MGEEATLTPLMGLISGIGHPVLGIDHGLFLVSIAFVGITNLKRWVIPMLLIGLMGSAFAQIFNLEILPIGTEVIVALTLATSGCVALGLLPAPLLLPMMFLHGVVLGSVVVGSEPTPILFYFIGLLIGQAVLLVSGCSVAHFLHSQLTLKRRRVLGFCWIGLGLALAWSASAAI